jgi:hypothetical protein
MARKTTETFSPIKPRLLDRKATALYLGCAFWAVRQLIYAGELHPFKIGGKEVMDIVDLDAWIEKKKKIAAYATALT